MPASEVSESRRVSAVPDDADWRSIAGDLRPVDRFEVGRGRGVGGPLVDEDQGAGGVLAVDAEDAEGVVRVDPVVDGHRGAGATFGEQTLEPRPDACRVRSFGGGEREQVGGDS